MSNDLSDIYMGFDTETGGFKPAEHSLLTAYFGFATLQMDGSYKIFDELDLAMKDPTGKYRVTQGAMDVNKINLVEHDKVAITCIEAAKLLFAKLEEITKGGTIKIIPVGQNIPFDESFVWVNLMPKSVWERYFYTNPKDKKDTKVLLKQKQTQGKIPKGQSLSLGPAAHFLGVKVDDGQLHGAKYDTHTTFGVLEKVEKL